MKRLWRIIYDLRYIRLFFGRPGYYIKMGKGWIATMDWEGNWTVEENPADKHWRRLG